MEGPKQRTPEEIAKLEKSRTISAAELLKDGAEYVVGRNGEKILRITKEQKSLLAKEDLEGFKETKILENLMDTFGGHIGMPPSLAGMALVGQVFNGKISMDNCVAEFDRLTGEMHKEHARSGVDIGLIREHVLRGMEKELNETEFVNFKSLESVSVIRGKYEEYKS